MLVEFIMFANVGGIASKGLRPTSESDVKKVDAGHCLSQIVEPLIGYTAC